MTTKQILKMAAKMFKMYNYQKCPLIRGKTTVQIWHLIVPRTADGVKVECNSDIHMLSVNREGQEDLTVNILAKLDKPFLELWIFEVLVNPYYGHLLVGNSTRIYDVIADNSPLVMYIDFHKI